MADASVRVPASGFSGIRRRHGVDALNSVKLELGLAVLLCITVALVLAVLPLARWLEFVLLVAFTMAAGWVMLRTRRVLQRLAVAREAGGGDGAQQE